MGTNYYAIKTKPSVHNHKVHLGKQSLGWRFHFQETSEITDYPSFLKWLNNNVDTGDYVILDEYDEPATKEELLETIASNQNGRYLLDDYVRLIDGYVFDKCDFC